MNANRQRADLRTLQYVQRLLMRQFEILIRGHQQFNQADIVMAGDNARTGAGRQYALNARGALFRVVAAPQLQIDIAAGNRLKGTGVEHRGGKARQFAGFIQPQ